MTKEQNFKILLWILIVFSVLIFLGSLGPIIFKTTYVLGIAPPPPRPQAEETFISHMNNPPYYWFSKKTYLDTGEVVYVITDKVPGEFAYFNYHNFNSLKSSINYLHDYYDISWTMQENSSGVFWILQDSYGDSWTIQDNPYVFVNKTTVFISNITKSIPIVINLERLNVSLINLKILVNNEVRKVWITVDKLEQNRLIFQQKVSGYVYHYINISKTNIQDVDINKTFIQFKVEKSWINQNNINESTIVLYKYTTLWEKLKTTKIKDDANFSYFEAESPSLSIFAISGEVNLAPTCQENWSCIPWSACVNNIKTRTCTDLNNCGTTVNKPAESQSCAAAVCGNNVCEAGETTENCPADCPKEEAKPWLLYVGVLIVIILFIIILLVSRKISILT